MLETKILDGKYEKNIEIAALELKNNEIVAFPTETVYGLGASIFSDSAIEKIFAAKGRPSDNPLIVHVNGIDMAKTLAFEWNDIIQKMVDEFWPGPLTICVKKTDIVSDKVTAGLSTVAIRMPDNNIANRLISICDFPIAAPSANVSGRPSPTLAQHVYKDLFGKIKYIIDGGQTRLGLESTVIDFVDDKIRILREGNITKEQIEKIHDKVEKYQEKANEQPISPGMKYKHYAPKTQIVVIRSLNNNLAAKKICELYDEEIGNNKNVIILCTNEDKKLYSGKNIKIIGNEKNITEIGKNLYKVFLELEDANTDIALCKSFDTIGVGSAIMNKLAKASGGNIIDIN